MVFFFALLMVFGVSPFTKKPSRQPSPVEVVFRRSPRVGGLVLRQGSEGDRTRRSRGARSKKGPECGRPTCAAVTTWTPPNSTRAERRNYFLTMPRLIFKTAKRRCWREGCLQAGALTARTEARCGSAVSVTAPQRRCRQRHIVRSFIPPKRGSRVRIVWVNRIK